MMMITRRKRRLCLLNSDVKVISNVILLKMIIIIIGDMWEIIIWIKKNREIEKESLNYLYSFNVEFN